MFWTVASHSWLDSVWKILGTKHDQSTENLSYNRHQVYKKKRKLRALILQGGGAIGAFQAGAFKALYERLTQEDIQSGNGGRPLFDIVAGTSIGAINATVLVSHVLDNKTWIGSAEKTTKARFYCIYSTIVPVNTYPLILNRNY